ncbi:substrate-binding domain-containing protein [Marinisporobacter balticus]|uniref:Tungstate transport system substrate-binding protein n=1 Tax=Marinisporobacter balticus TaxID=2018667 RepID=A0A4V2SBZ2_9FIRM|nr:substrate-binding domain-containing protein [Marinisporobacter balticus]TCO77400.1 tungstate transport system substrate-binding protein [Marinisporobacter balticus]
MKKIKLLVVLMFVVMMSIGCTSEIESKEKAPIILATTTSTENSGLLDHILPTFVEKYGREVKVVAVGTGKALEMGRNGEADVLLVHALASELEFVEAGHGLERYDVMYNDFVIIGPKGQTIITADEMSDASLAFAKLAQEKATFISRGDDSGTHKKEIALWEKAGVKGEGDGYISTGKGMGDTITMADEMQGFTLSDRATYLSMKNDLDLEIAVEGDPLMFNQYGVIPVNPNKNDKINEEGANEFTEWIRDENCQQMIAKFGVDTYGQALFTPNAQ